jgi:3'(2'), 5'-bisphosphate nucleotidase
VVIELDHLEQIAERAGAAILDVYRAAGELAIDHKDDRSPLTEADRRSHHVIVQALAEADPHTPMVSEEDAGGSTDAMQGDYWLIDPLDGTKEFIKRTGEFTVNIALVRDGVPVLGVVHAPVMGMHWLGSSDGAWRRKVAGIGEVSERVPISVRRQPDPARLRVVASRDHAGEQVRRMLDRLPDAETLSMGSSLKFCLIAEGHADLYYRDGPTMPWDTAAAHAVLRAAGGEVHDIAGPPLRYHTPRVLNPQFVAVGDPELSWSSIVKGETT